MANLKLGDAAIAFNLPGVDGRQHALEDYADPKGCRAYKQAVAVIFSCNHCPYVRAWEDRMVQIQRDAERADKGVQLVAISPNDAQKYPDDSFPKMHSLRGRRAREKGFNFPYLYDETQEIAHAYGAQRTPEVFLFDKNRALRYHGAIDDNYDDPRAVREAYLRQALDAVLAGQTPQVTQTPPVGCTVKWK